MSKIKRTKELVQILSKYGFEQLLAGSKLAEHIPEGKKKERLEKYTVYERVRMAIEELGTTYIKLGQFLSTQSGLIPEELSKEMEKFQDDVDPVEIDIAAFVLEEIGKPAEELFSDITDTPMATASIGQVYSAQMVSGQAVVLKVQRPEIESNIKGDLAVLRDLARLMEKREELKNFEPVKNLADFEVSILRELDYSGELLNIQRFKSYHQGEDDLYAPEVYPEASSKKLLCMERIEGIKIKHKDKLVEKGYDLKQLIDSICDSYFDQMFGQGFFHADPHPGNLVVMEGGRVCLLDFGMMTEILPDDKRTLGELFIALMQNDTKKVIMKFEQLASSVQIRDRKELEYEILEICNMLNATAGTFDMAGIIDKLLAIMRKNRIITPGYFQLLLRTLAYLEGLIVTILPEQNLMDLMRPYLDKVMKKGLNLKQRIKSALSDLSEIEYIVRRAPTQISRVIDKLSTDSLYMGFEIKDLQTSLDRLDRMTNRIVLALILGSLLLASSVVVLAKVPPLYNGVPVLGTVGFVISAILGFYVLWRIFRGKKI